MAERERASYARTLVVPMYREAPRIARTIHTLATSSLNDPRTEIILVDDGSDDDTVAVARAALGATSLTASIVRLERNLGKGGAVRAGVLASSGRAVAFSDADLSVGVADIERCFAPVESGNADVVCSSRAAAGSVIPVRQPRLRELSGRTFNLALRLLGLTRLHDTQCGLKVFAREAALLLFEQLSVTGFAFDVELLLFADRLGLRVEEVPVEWRHVEESRVRPLRDGVAMLRDALRLRLAPRVRRRGPRPTSMRDETFAVMAKLEREHWWFRAKRELAVQELRRAGTRDGAAADVGCGTGASAAALRALGFHPLIGIDPSSYAIGLAHKGDGNTPFVVARAEALPLKTGSSGCVLCMDVLEHMADDVATLGELGRVVRPGSTLLLTVPAYGWAWSDHDVTLGHHRRYTARTLRRRVRAAGFIVRRCTYFHSWLVPLAFLVRKTPLARLMRGSAEEASFVSPGVNRLLHLVSRAERGVIRMVRLPFGLSIMLVAERPASQKAPE